MRKRSIRRTQLTAIGSSSLYNVLQMQWPTFNIKFGLTLGRRCVYDLRVLEFPTQMVQKLE